MNSRLESQTPQCAPNDVAADSAGTQTTHALEAMMLWCAIYWFLTDTDTTSLTSRSEKRSAMA